MDTKQLAELPSEPGLTVFISYSRRDLEFAEAVADRLDAADIEILIDKRNLPYGEEWKAELLQFIRSSDTVLFVVSPHSIASEWCNWELEHTKRESKRLVPIVLEPVEVDGLPSAVADIHLLSFEDHWRLGGGASETFDETVEMLRSILLTNIDWLREHTRLGDLARRWNEARARDKAGAAEARLLRGEVLAEAELWISKRPREAPEPTAEQRQFILASRQHEQAAAKLETRRARRRTGLAIAAAAVLAVSTVAVFSLYVQSNHNLVLALLTKADQYLAEERPTKALAVAGSMLASPLAGAVKNIAAVFMPASEEHIRTETIIQVAGVGSMVPSRIVHVPQSSKRVAFSGDGVHFAVGYRSGHVMVDRVDGSGTPRWFKAHNLRLVGIAFGPDGKWLASATQEGIVVWNLSEGKAFPICDLPGDIREISFSPSGAYLAAVSYDGRLTVWQTTDWTLLRSFDEHDGKSTGISFSPTGNLVVTVGDSGKVVVRNTSDWSVFRSFETGRSDLISVAFAPDGKEITTASINGEVDIWNVASADPALAGRPLPVPEAKRWKVRYSPDGRRIAVASWDGTVRVWDTETLDYAGTIDGHDHWIVDLAFSPDSSMLLTASESGIARLWEMNGLRPMFFAVKDDPRETLIGRYSPDGNVFVSGGREGIARAYSVDADGRLTFICGVQHPAWVNSLGFTADSRYVVTAATSDQDPSNRIRVWSARDCRVSEELEAGPDYVTSVAVDPASAVLAWSNYAGEVWIRNGSAGARARVLTKYVGVAVTRLAFSTGGTYLAIGRRNGGLEIWNLAQGERHRTLTGHTQVVLTLDFSPVGDLLASGGPDHQILIWDLSRPPGQELLNSLAVRGGTNDLAFNSDGTLLAAGSDASYIVMWTVADWEKVFHLHALVGVRSVFGFHPSRGDLAFDGGGGLIRVLQPRSGQPVTPDDVKAVVTGTDVSFDQMSVQPVQLKETSIEITKSPTCGPGDG